MGFQAASAGLGGILVYIETTSRNTVLDSLVRCLNMNYSEFFKKFIFTQSDTNNEREAVDVLYNAVLQYAKQCGMYRKLNQILLFHLGRRLKDAENDNRCLNLYELLLTDNAMSNFLKKHALEFRDNSGHIDIIYRGTLVRIGDFSDTLQSYFNSRLGFVNRGKDFCVNGYAFKADALSGCYARILGQAPEFLQSLSEALEYSDLVRDYEAESAYYLFKYRFPLKEVIFGLDSFSNSLNNKKEYFMHKVCERVVDACFPSDSYVPEGEVDGLQLRLKDNASGESQHFICKKEIAEKDLKS